MTHKGPFHGHIISASTQKSLNRVTIPLVLVFIFHPRNTSGIYFRLQV